MGLDDDQVQAICAQAAQGEVVEAVNFNSPGQVVIAGNVAAVERAMAAAKEAGAKRALPLPVSVPSHCSLMKPAAEKLAAELSAAGLDVLLDDRDGVSPGVRFKDAELLGMPMIVIAGRGVAKGVLEVRDRIAGTTNEMPIADVAQHVIAACA